MRGKIRFLMACALLLGVVFGSGVTRAFAYSTDGQRFVYNVNYCYYASSIPSSWSTSLSNARSAWNNAGSPLRINYSSSGSSYVYAAANGNNGVPARARHTVHPNPFQPKLHSAAVIEFNNYYSWSTSGAAGKLDVQNTATHELGHWVYLADLYGGSDTEKTMYGYISAGETKKRSLHSDDIAGVNYLY